MFCSTCLTSGSSTVTWLRNCHGRETQEIPNERKCGGSLKNNGFLGGCWGCLRYPETDVIPRFRWRKLLRQTRTCRLSFKSIHKMIYTINVDKNPTPLAGLSSVQVHSSVVMCHRSACFERPLDQVLSRLLFCCDGLKRFYRICAR